MPVTTPPRERANVLGLGLIGGSIALALAESGYEVCGEDADHARVEEALSRSVISRRGLDPDAIVTFVATPVGTVADQVHRALSHTKGYVTDVGSVKAPISSLVDDPRFVPGHPMAGSELDGLDGADGSMFRGAVWVLTPGPSTGDEAFAAVASLVSSFGAEVVALEPHQHDVLVAVVSHVPHLTAATMMSMAARRGEDHAALLRLAAGGFRDMTRIASGRSSIWLDICEQNRDAIVEGLDGLITGLQEMRLTVETKNREQLAQRLEDARQARLNLPSRASRAEDLAEVRIPIPDRPGAAAEVFALSADLGVNIYDFEVMHSIEGDRGVMVTVIDAAHVDLFRGGLLARGLKPAVTRLSE